MKLMIKYMKKLLGILVLGLFLTTPSWADDIRDFQIEGMSIGDSLLDYFSKDKIKLFINDNNAFFYKSNCCEYVIIIKFVLFIFLDFFFTKIIQQTTSNAHSFNLKVSDIISPGRGLKTEKQ